jgi:hypothetical protein
MSRAERAGQTELRKMLKALVAIADLVDVVDHSHSRWFHGPYGFVLDNVHPLKRPVACSGARGFWVVPPHTVAAIKRQLSERDRQWMPLERGALP